MTSLMMVLSIYNFTAVLFFSSGILLLYFLGDTYFLYINLSFLYSTNGLCIDFLRLIKCIK